MSEVRKFRVGVVLDSMKVTAWQLELLRSIHESDESEVVLVVLDDSPLTGRSALRRFVYAALGRIQPRLGEGLEDACALNSTADLIENIPRVRTGFATSGETHVSDSIRKYDLDVLLTLAGGDAPLQWRRLTRLGLMYFDMNGLPLQPHDGAMIGLLETLRRKACFSTTLKLIGPQDDECRVVYETHSPVDPWSHPVTRNQHLWKCSTFPARALRAYARLGRDEYLRSRPLSASVSPSKTPAKLTLSDDARLLLAFVSYIAWRIWQKAYRRFFTERWVLMVGRHADDLEHALFEPCLPPPERFWADPHVIESGGKYFVFFEDADRRSGIGHIAVSEVSDTGQLLRTREILTRPYHLSYPFVFRWNDCHYLIPESASNRTVELYRCIEFPGRWVFSHNLIEDIYAYDATLFENQGRWWMFANVKEREEASSWDELHLFWADSPVSRHWNAHPANPVISDVRCARPAGPVFSRGGRFVRPSQDSSGRYGLALNLNQIVELTATTYRETLLRQMAPGDVRNAVAVHSYSCAGQLAFVDAIIRERRFGRGAATT